MISELIETYNIQYGASKTPTVKKIHGEIRMSIHGYTVLLPTEARREYGAHR
jgi:hypothetical protein